MFTFYIENHEPFGALTKNGPKLDKNKSIVSRFSVFVVYKSAVCKQRKLFYSKGFCVRTIFLHRTISFTLFQRTSVF